MPNDSIFLTPPNSNDGMMRYDAGGGMSICCDTAPHHTIGILLLPTYITSIERQHSTINSCNQRLHSWYWYDALDDGMTWHYCHVHTIFIL
mmetsp:Transcript_10737/g.23809  ORF Transcript_10737/g.23809 Transcript_10737/m.23809 type:complete len:91 (+) Transcript_10737:346-618(+)